MRRPADQRWSSLRSLALRPGLCGQVGMLYRYHEPSTAPMWGDAACRNGRHARCRRLSGHPALVAQRIEHLTTDQKVGGSSPSERATYPQVRSHLLSHGTRLKRHAGCSRVEAAVCRNFRTSATLRSSAARAPARLRLSRLTTGSRRRGYARGMPPSRSLVLTFDRDAVPLGEVLDRQVESLRAARDAGDPDAAELVRAVGEGTDMEPTLQAAREAIARNHGYP